MRFLLLFVVFFAALAAQAEEIPGRADPAFEAALTKWLNGDDDIAALEDLAALARADNTAAQITLGMIERNPALSAYRPRLFDRETRRAIFRSPDGKFGRTWLRVAADTNAYARAHVLPMLPENLDEIFEVSLAAGNLRDAWIVATTGYNHTASPLDLRRFAHPDLLPHVHRVIASFARSYVTAGELVGFTREERAALDGILSRLQTFDTARLPPLRNRFDPANDPLTLPEQNLRAYGAALLTHPDMEFMTRWVQDACPTDTAFHMGVAASVPTKYPLGLMQESPLIHILSTEDWRAAPRAFTDARREVSAIPHARNVLKRLSPCLLP